MNRRMHFPRHFRGQQAEVAYLFRGPTGVRATREGKMLRKGAVLRTLHTNPTGRNRPALPPPPHPDAEASRVAHPGRRPAPPRTPLQRPDPSLTAPESEARALRGEILSF